MYVKPKKSLGQHFLHDKTIAENITKALSENTANLLEIGPGTGVLTRFLINNKFNFKTIEIDNESIEYLKKTYPDIKNNLIKGDFLKINLNELFGEKFSIIGNLPYYISSQIFFKILDEKNMVPEVVCMVQKEVAQRIAENPGSKIYGILSVLIQAFYDTEYLFTVNENAFTPPPKVKSAVIKLRRNDVEHLNCNEILFKKVVKTTFNQRRKIIRNSLKLILGDTQLPENKYLKMRPEQLNVSDFVELTNYVATIKPEI